VEDGDGFVECWDTLIDTGEDFGSLELAEFDIFRAILNDESDQVGVDLLIRSSKPAEGRSVNVIYAVYDSAGRMLGLVMQSEELGPEGLDAGGSVPCDPENLPVSCKAFVLSPDCSPETGSLFTTVR